MSCLASLHRGSWSLNTSSASTRVQFDIIFFLRPCNHFITHYFKHDFSEGSGHTPTQGFRQKLSTPITMMMMIMMMIISVRA